MNLITKIKSDLNQIPFKRVVVGCSGGMDSVVLAHVLKELGYEVIIAHLNHQLRGKESDKDEKFVKDLAKKWKIPYIISKKQIPKYGNLENNARLIRYKFLETVRRKLDADYTAVGHHLDDQIETILMHIARGAGLRGQRGMEYVSGNILRPLIDVPKKEIEKYARKNKLKYITDKSNFDLSHERNIWRHHVIPRLKKEDKDFEEKIRDISSCAGEKLEKVIKEAKNWMKENLVDNRFNRDMFNVLSNDIKSEIIIQILGADDLYQKSIDKLMRFINFGQTGKKMIVKGQTFLIEYESIAVGMEQKEVELPKKRITVKGIKWGKWKIKSKYGQTLYVRQWQEGDKFQPKGMKGTKKIRKFFIDKKIPQSERKQIPIIVNSKNDIMAVGDLRVAKGADDLKNNLSIN
jgi:tRNA(Ile)-lysidine synthase